jgi:threonine dehydratase
MTDLVQPTYEDVLRAAKRIEGAAHRTPVLTSRSADAMTRARLFFKAENLQRGGAFKFRGAYNAISALSPAQRKAGVVAYSSGNHAQALSYAAQLLGSEATIIMPEDAPAVKVAATRAYGGKVRTYNRYTEDREAIARSLASEEGLTLIPPYDHPEIIAGQGTAAMELLEEVLDLDVLIVPLGGGGLLAGTSIVAKHVNPAICVVGVEPEAGNDGQQSLAAGRIVTIEVPRSIADGALVTHLGQHTFPILRDLVDEIVTVPDAALVEAMRFFLERMKIVVEPTGCLGAAAAFAGAVAVKDLRVGIVLSGGNVDVARLATLLAT